ncbi:hypothetical protein ONE63_008153 [Megalurothrips usitatus]|uniref:Uncharacterized protein n=1 Tax=Megalurothrips usitatus TaxID=439358 RepID=A0AAV7XLM7_9NEOP|nr:hypothetical protein ONE63_008153 [Megalurothrips usitatus]
MTWRRYCCPPPTRPRGTRTGRTCCTTITTSCRRRCGPLAVRTPTPFTPGNCSWCVRTHRDLNSWEIFELLKC